MKLSARNQIPARVTGINPGEAIANVELDAGGVRLMASITVEAVRDLGLTEGSEVIAMIKASDVIVAVSLSSGLPSAGRLRPPGGRSSGGRRQAGDRQAGDVRRAPWSAGSG
jgi:molybdopterin-binding protein